jgi:uncharacterized protein (TIGR00375 family)
MRFIADLHIHSPYSRATSRELTPENLYKWSCLKGISVLGTGDITHPTWLSQLKEKLITKGNGLFTLKPELSKTLTHEIPDACKIDVQFMLTGEISCIYKKNDKVRKIHTLVFFPDFEACERFNNRLDKIGNITSDGRPILGLDAKNLLEIQLETVPNGFFVPAHIWTPHFSLFGSKSGFDNIEECFEDLTSEIFALETGLSSDPAMNWLVSKLDKYSLISNSDAHSAANLGRECNLFDTEPDFASIKEALKTKKGFEMTVEFYPEQGRYHYDGHRNCQACLHPSQTLKAGLLCPVCGKKVTVGVLHRVLELADREPGFEPQNAVPFKRLVPLAEVIASVYDCGKATKKVNLTYQDMLIKYGSELEILTNIPYEDIQACFGESIAEALRRNREGQVKIEPGFDGEYGKVKVFEKREQTALSMQGELFE